MGLTMNSNAVTVTVSGTQLPGGSYKLVSAGVGGSVTGNVTDSVVTVNGAGAVASARLQIVNGELYLNVGVSTLALSSSSPTNGYKDNVVFTAMLQTNGVTAGNAGGTVTFQTNGVSFNTNTVSASSTTSTSLNMLPRGTNVIAAIYSGDANYFASTNTLNQIVTNHPPVATSQTVTRITPGSA